MLYSNCIKKVLGVFIVASLASIPPLYAQTARTIPVAYTSGISKSYVRTWTATAPQQIPNTLVTRPLREVKQSTQYLDGLGRPLQAVIKEGSLITNSTPVDMISAIEYDPYYREPNKYLPSPSTATDATKNDGNFKLNPFIQQAAFYDNAYATNPIKGQAETFFYGQTTFENSPLNRVLESAAPGNSWTGTMANLTEATRRSVKMKYYVNSAVDAVIIWNVAPGAIGSFSTYTNSGMYADGLLLKSISVDENGKQVIEFKDKEGKVILKKVQLTAATDDGITGSGYPGWLCTYYLYDDLSNLRCVIQPRGVELVSAASWVLTDATILAEQCFRYEYDQRNRMIIKKVPGAGEAYMVYDVRDRLVMTQDANLRTSAQWMVTLYDDLNRPLQTGKFTTASTFATLLGTAYTAGTSIATAYPFANNTTPTGSTWENLTITHYDDYASLPAGLTGTLYNSGYATYLTATSASPDYAEPITQSLAMTGLATWTSVKVLGTLSQYISTVNIYDLKGRLIQTQTINVSNSLDVGTNQYSFANQVLRTHINHKKLSQTYDLATKNTYDDLGRITAVEKNLNNGGWKAINAITYDALGQLKTKKLSPAFNSNAGLENLNYDYNIRGWLLGENRDFVKDLSTANYFGFDLGYDKNGSLATYAPQYNGNISGTIWKSKGDKEKRKYDFTYDAVNRLSAAAFGQYVSGSGTSAVFDGTTAGVNFSVENLTYDANGNILTMWQKGLKLNTSDYINKLSYNYYSNNVSNKLLNVIDAVNDNTTKLGNFRASALYQTTVPTKTATTTADYTYDVNGNLTKDYNKDMVTAAGTDGIQYNYLNLPAVITVKNSATTNKGTITYTYDAAGNKLMKTTVELANAANNNIATTTTTTYIGGFVYETKTHVPSQTTDYTDVLQFMGQEEGRIRKKTDGTFAYDYFIKDHLSNVRMVLTEEQLTNIYPAATMEGTYDASTNSMVNYEKQFYRVDNTKIIAESAIASWVSPAETVANTKLYYNNNGNPPTNTNYPSGCTPIQTAGSNNVYKLNATTNRTGLEFMIKVMAGDKIDIFGKSYFLNTTTVNNSNSTTLDLLALMTNMLLAPSNAAAVKGLTPANLTTLNTSVLPNSFFTGANGETTTIPKAFINYIFFDEQFKYAGGGASRVGSSGVVKDHWTVDAQLQNITAPKNGYIFVYASNESNLDVFFDNLQVIHKPGAILEETHYYPFGLTMAGICSKAAGSLVNKRKYNAGSELQSNEFSDGSGLEMYDTYFRQLDPQLGRWWQLDPKCEPRGVDEDSDEENGLLSLESLTPYNSMGNNPIRYNDPKGDIFGIDNLIGAAIGAAIDYGSQVASNLANGKSLKQSLTQIDGKSIAVSAGIGFVTSGVGNVAGKLLSKVGTSAAEKLAPAVAKLVQSNLAKQSITAAEKVLEKGGMTSLKGVLDFVGTNTKAASAFFGWGNKTAISKGIGDFSKKELLANGWTKETLVALARGYNDQIVTKGASGAINATAIVRRDQVMQIVKTYFGK